MLDDPPKREKEKERKNIAGGNKYLIVVIISFNFINLKVSKVYISNKLRLNNKSHL